MKIHSSCLVFLLLISLVILGAAPAAGYESKVVVSTNPILDMFAWYNGEVEFAVAPTSTMGAAGTYMSFGDEDDSDEETYANASIFWRYYPREAFGGFYVGARGGYYRVTADTDVGDEEEGNFFGFGIDVGYSWILGENERMYVSLGAGAVRLFGGDLEDVTLTLPTIRIINVGLAF